jgi:DNA-binding PadR family transcriptional regulator
VSVRHALLGLLSEGPKYGMQLKEEFEAATGDAWPLNVGQVYTTLQRLERDGLVESDEAGTDERQRDYRITPRGEAELDGWLTNPPSVGAPPRDELTTKILVALRVPGVDVHEVIQVHRRQVVELMQQWTRCKQDEADLDLPFVLMVEAELARLDAVVKWLDLADRQVRRASKEAGREPARTVGPRLRRRVVVRP